MVPRAGIEPARQCDPAQDFKSCASTNFATEALRKLRGFTLGEEFSNLKTVAYLTLRIPVGETCHFR